MTTTEATSRRAGLGESVVAVDLQTGKRKWHYQLVHHGIWDMDIPCADPGGHHGRRSRHQGVGS